jgi:hypothetical protein
VRGSESDSRPRRNAIEHAGFHAALPNYFFAGLVSAAATVRVAPTIFSQVPLGR